MSREDDPFCVYCVPDEDEVVLFCAEANVKMAETCERARFAENSEISSQVIVISSRYSVWKVYLNW